MIPPRGWTRGLVGTAVALVVVAAMVMALPAGVAHADMAFRKKKAPAADTQATPTGGEVEGAGAAAGATEGDPAAKQEYVPQAEDRDRPRDPSLLDKSKVDAALAKKAQKDEGPPFYTKWQTWAIAGGVVVGAILAVWAGTKLAHEIGGGDVRSCNTAYVGCFGEGH